MHESRAERRQDEPRTVHEPPNPHSVVPGGCVTRHDGSAGRGRSIPTTVEVVDGDLRLRAAAEVLPPPPSGEKITYLRLTCSATGYQPSRREKLAAYADLDENDAFRLPGDEYFPCYGAHLNISVLPLRRDITGQGWRVGGDDLQNYPTIVSFEPKSAIFIRPRLNRARYSRGRSRSFRLTRH